MSITEEQARTKWCPMAFAGPEAWEKCCGSECMAWVQTDNLPDPPTHDGKSGEPYNPVYKPAGFCGLVRQS